MAKTAVILLNLGSPASPSPSDVRVYLKEFLNDPYVIDIAWILRKLLVDGIILNTRPKKTAEAYQKIWTEEGSPLLLYTKSLTEQVQKKISEPVFFAMRYGSPSIPETLAKVKATGADRIVFLPLYPQYSYAASESSIVEMKKWHSRLMPGTELHIIEDFFNHAGFIQALVETFKEPLARVKPDLVMLSYHGIPERQIAKTKNPPKVCCVPGCCDQWSKQNEQCYKAQCYETSRLMAKSLGLRDDQYTVAFQSRLGRTKWIEPYTDLILKDLPAKGIKRLLVASPSFTSDCLETLEEIQLRYRELFLEAGGEYFEYVPCVNATPTFVDAVVDLVKK